MAESRPPRKLCVLSENRVDARDLGLPAHLGGWSLECLSLAETEPSRLRADVLLLALPPDAAGLRAWIARFRVFQPAAQVLLAEYDEARGWYRLAIQLGIDGLLRLPLDAAGWHGTLADCAEAITAGEAQRRLVSHLERSSLSLEESRRHLAEMLLESYENLGRVHAQLEERLGQLSILYRLGRDLGRDANWDAALERFLSSCIETLEFRGVALMLWSFDASRLSVRAERDLAGPVLARALRQLGRLPQAEIVDSAVRGILAGEFLSGEALAARLDEVELLALPLVQGEEPLGFFVFRKPYESAAAYEGDFHFLRTVQTLIGEAIAGAKSLHRLRRLGEFNRSVLESVHAAVLTVDGKGLVSYRNPRAAKLFGPRFAVGDAFRFGDGFAPREGAADGDATALESGDWIQRECRLGGADGEESRSLLVSASQLPLRHESDARHVLVCEDLTEHKRLEAELRRAERLSSLGQLSAGMAHEIRNPLAGIAMTAQVLQSRLSGQPEAEPYLARILDEVQRLERIVRSLLDYSRPARPELGAVELGESAALVLADLAGQAAAAGVKLAGVESAGPCPALADRDQLQQVLLNLLQNAIQACAPGDRVGIRLERAAAARGGAGLARLVVWDSGPGVPEAAAAKLFDPFYTTKAEGTGLGLSVCQQIVKEHGGRLAYRRAPAGGSEFVLELAAASANFSHEER